MPALPGDGGDLVQGVPFDTFLSWFKDVWQPGEHMALVGPTGEGKSTFAGHILSQRKYVMAYDAKGGDSTLASFGFTRVSSWPMPKKILEDIAEGRDARINLGVPIHYKQDWLVNRGLLSRAIDQVFADGGWTEYWDEYQLSTDRKMVYKFGSKSEEHLIAARDKKLSVVTSFQAPAWVPSAATRQSTWIACWRTRDEDVIKSLARKFGRPWREFKPIVENLPKYHVLVGGRDPFEPLVLTSVPKL